jgi:hypothetical protein
VNLLRMLNSTLPAVLKSRNVFQWLWRTVESPTLSA